MLKYVAIAIVTFLVSGIAMEAIWGTIIRGTKQVEAPAAGQFIRGQAFGETIEPLHTQETASRQPRGGRLRQEDCSAVNLNTRAHPYFVGTVTDVIDGDTINVRVEGARMRVRLWGIDAPENNQPNGSNARENLKFLAPVDSKIEIHPVSMDQNGWVVGSIGNGQDFAINFSMVAYGWAYHVAAFDSENNRCLMEAEKTARTRKIGVWKFGEGGGVRPWEHRQQELQQREKHPQEDKEPSLH